MTDLQLYSQIAALPSELKEEVQNLVKSLSKKIKPSKKIKERQFGCGKGLFIMAPDFDEPLEDFKAYM